MALKSLADLREEMRSAARGKRKPFPVPTAPTPAALSEESLTLLKAVAASRPANVSELVVSMGKTQAYISRALQRLAKQGFVRMIREGREVRPELVSRFLTVDVLEGTVRPDTQRAT